MAVFTQVNNNDLLQTMQRFGLGEIVGLQGISAGIENTNYFLNTQLPGQGVAHWVLTIFENLDNEDLPYFVHLTRHLDQRGLVVPAPLIDQDGDALIDLHGKKAMIVPKLEGASHTQMSVGQCEQVGEWLARMHLALQDFSEHRPLVRNLDWMLAHQKRLNASGLPQADQALLSQLIDRYSVYREVLMKCPQGTVHGDLFRDNVLFKDDHISGVIDFYHACNASLLFDLAVCANDWTTNTDGTYHHDKLAALVSGYKAQRVWSALEEQNWLHFLELAALRFWISRLVSKYTEGYQQEGVLEGDTIKDPDELRRILMTVLSMQGIHL